MIVTIGTDDTLASPGAQLDYYQSLIDKMGQRARSTRSRGCSSFRRRITACAAGTTPSMARGRRSTVAPIPNTFDRVRLLFDWVERKLAPPASGDRHRRQQEPAAVRVSAVPALLQRADNARGFVQVRRAVSGILISLPPAARTP